MGKQYQYTAIDKYPRWRFVEAFEEHSTYSSAQLEEHLVKAFPCPIEYIQTDNGTEFTNRFTTHREKPLLSSKCIWKCTGSVTRSSGLLRCGIMGRWNAATGRIMSVFTQCICFIPLRTLPPSSKCITEEIIIISLCVRLAGKPPIKCSGIIYAQCNKCLTNLHIGNI